MNNYCLPLLLLGLLLLLAPAARAQQPASLVGEWDVREISFVARTMLSHEMQEQLDDSTIARLNNDLRGGDTQLRVEFRADGSYLFGRYDGGQTAWTEAGTYRLAGGVLYGEAPAAPNGSSFERSRVVELTRRKLVLEFPFGDPALQLTEQVEYRRRPGR